MKPIRLTKPGVTKFEKMAGAARRDKAFRELVMRLGKPKKTAPRAMEV